MLVVGWVRVMACRGITAAAPSSVKIAPYARRPRGQGGGRRDHRDPGVAPAGERHEAAEDDRSRTLSSAPPMTMTVPCMVPGYSRA